ncbi:hypothetical protein [Actinospica robiniae]|uniref:hypothetical protein n=1 Tax=Actinospica robiniae TaxID=304901 RepID=UPI0012FA48DF|nr:hypothetical protein [Actinospica robiniae]
MMSEPNLIREAEGLGTPPPPRYFDFGTAGFRRIDGTIRRMVVEEVDASNRRVLFLELEAPQSERLRRNVGESRLAEKPSKRNLESSRAACRNSMHATSSTLAACSMSVTTTCASPTRPGHPARWPTT